MVTPVPPSPTLPELEVVPPPEDPDDPPVLLATPPLPLPELPLAEPPPLLPLPPKPLPPDEPEPPPGPWPACVLGFEEQPRTTVSDTKAAIVVIFMAKLTPDWCTPRRAQHMAAKP
jgi:hypothetical protein